MKKISLGKSQIVDFFTGNIYMVLLWRILLLFGLYSIMRVLFYVINYSEFGAIPANEFWIMMKGGCRFDGTAIFYTNIPIILLHAIPFRFRYNAVYQKVTAILFYVVNSVMIVVNMADAIYYRFTLQRTTMAVFSEFQNENPTNFLHFIWDYWYITLIVAALIVLVIWIYGKIKVKKPVRKLAWYFYYPLSLALMAFIVYQSVGVMRGGWTHGTRPITLSNAAAYITKPEYRSIVLNTPFSLIRTIGKTKLERVKYFTEDQINQLFSTKQHVNDSSAYHAAFKGKNVVIIIWESFSKEWVGALNKDIPGYTGYTPFIDSLIPKSYVFEKAFANGRKSIDAIPSIMGSIPSLETPFILSNYSGNTINSVASLLKPEGYYSAFFHGAPNGSMGFDAFVKQARFDDYFGMNEFNNAKEFDGHWGIWDEPFLQFMAKKIAEFPEPFVTSVFTLSSHDPYKIPASYEGKFPKGDIPIHQCIGYSDNALRLFFETASKEKWFNNTLFVITADHAVNGFLEEYKNARGAFAIPMIFYAPGDDFTAFNDSTVVQQNDIMPTVLSLVGCENQFISFGNNMFDETAPHFAVNYFNGAFQIFEQNYFLQFSNDKAIGFYDFATDPELKTNLSGKMPAEQTGVENRLKAFLQQFNERVLDNKMTVDE